MGRWVWVMCLLVGCQAPSSPASPTAEVLDRTPAPDEPAPDPQPTPTQAEAEPEPEPEPEPYTAVPGFSCLELQPLGSVPVAALDVVESAIGDTYRVQVRRRPPRTLPRAAWYTPRRRYRAEKLLVDLETNAQTECEHVLGVTTKDISTTKGSHRDWGILGLGDMPGKAAVISTFRTKKAVRRVAPEERLARVAIHEVGHTLGLPHCPTQGCLLSDAGGTVRTIDEETELCEICRGRLSWRGDAPVSRPQPP